jgi:short-subunit dehydrogenase involved in D-alanine esterification of teichoic acids
LDCIVLNAGIQRTLDFTNPKAINLAVVDAELATNYTSPLHTLIHMLPHLQSRAPDPVAIIIVSSGLALVPHPRPPNYCATKSAIHALAWTLRAQLADHDDSQHIRVVEIIPPAVKTELHSQQDDLKGKGELADFGLPLDEFLREAWTALEKGEEDEIPIAGVRHRFYDVEAERRSMFGKFLELLKGQAVKL